MAVRRPSLFPFGDFGSPTQFPIPPASPGAPGEIDLRAELDEFFFGYKSGIRHGWPVVLRRMRRDSNGKKIACTCRDDKTREADPDCSYCQGERYLWDEEWVWTYATYVGGSDGLANKVKFFPAGAIRVDFRTFYFRYDANLKYGDKIVEMKLDEEGELVVPYIRKAIYSPQTIIEHRSDNSRIEYITAECREEDAIRPDNFD